MDIVGIDIGFGFTKILKGRETRVFKSVYGDATDVQFKENVLDEFQDGGQLHIELEGGSYFVGELAERQSVERFFTLDQHEFVHHFVKVLALAGLAGMVGRNEPVKLVTGLPISQFRRHKKQLARTLKDTHHVTMIRGEEREETVVKVQDVRVVPQPFGSVLDLMLNDIGEVADTSFLREKVGIIDVGFRTTDYTIADKAHYAERGSRTTDFGISRAFRSIADHVQEVAGITPELYRLYDAVERGHIKVRGREIGLEEVVRKAFTQLAKVVATEANRLWTDDWDIDRVILTGGGGKVLAPYLSPQILGEVEAVDPGADARFNNVRGYYRYAMRLWSRGAAAPQPEADDAREA